MRDIPLQEIITAHTDLLATQAEEFLPMIRLLLLLGEGPISPERLAARMQWTLEETKAFLGAAGLVVDAEGHIQTVAGAGCALDTLLVPMLTGQLASVVASCPATGRDIRLIATPLGVEEFEPPSAVLSLRLPGPTTQAETVRGTICTYGHFFADREHAASWPALHPEAVLLPVDEAAQLARAIVSAARSYADSAEG